MIKLIECPRDAMQGLHDFIPTETKANYVNKLLRCGFDTIDFGSFVSPKAIPQLRDTAEVLKKLELDPDGSRLLAIVANLRGAEDALKFDEIDFLGFPLSISETFQQRNTNRSIAEALVNVAEIQNLCQKHGKTLVTYISMGFGNPYDDPYDPETVATFVQRLDNLQVEVISLADTIGVSNPDVIKPLFETLIPAYPHIEFGAHLHSTPDTIVEKLEAAWDAGCKRFDGAVKGFGGCPMAKDDLVGNMATEVMLNYFQKRQIPTAINREAFAEVLEDAPAVFA